MSDKPQQPEVATEGIRTIYISDQNYDALRSMASASDSSGSVILRKIFEDYLAGKLIAVKETPRKTSVWISPDLWERVKVKSAEDRISIAKVIDAGMRKLRGQ